MIIAIVNHKGGVGKTTTAASLGAALQEHGRRVLLVDLDPQASLTVTFADQAHQKTIYHALLEEGVAVKDTIVPVRERLSLIPSGRDLAAADLLLAQEADGDLYLRRTLAPVTKAYDVILLDCPPNLAKLTINALVAADAALIPLSSSFLSLKPLGQLLDTIEQVKARRNPSLAILGFLLTRFSRTTLHAAEVEERVREMFKAKVFTTVIGQSVRFEEAPAVGQTILEYEPSHPGALAYRAVAKEVIHRGKTRNLTQG